MASAARLTRPALRRFTVDEYHRMLDAGVLHEDDRVELIEGVIIAMAALGGRHVGCVIETSHRFAQLLGETARVSIQNAVRLDRRSEPEPDIAILRPRADGYRTDLPRAEDVQLIIEVADTSLAYDRDTKLPLYARAGIPEVWLVDLNGGQVLVYRGPSGRRYQHASAHGRGATLAPLAFPDIALTVDAILG